ncbi:MAG: RusA family crossover junction endodeoxyribonuclease [Nitrospirae bacterium]|nr:RusA family crossover junction endodeoxyribonuclease [Nitrospirota bacterium]
MEISFTVQTKPVPQARPRFFVRRKGNKSFVGAYDPKQCKTFKEVIAWHARIKMKETGIREATRDPIAISLIFGMGQGGKQRFHVKRPDIDNLAKAVKDALKGIVYADDSQIVEAHLYKQYGGPEIRIEIKTLEEI